MSDTIQVGRRFVPLEHIVLLEPFDPATQPRMQSEKAFQTRIVLIDRDSVLSEESLAELATRHSFRMLEEDGIAVSPLTHFSVEAFEPREGFAPNKPYKSRLLWRGPSQEFESKLLMTAPEALVAIAVRGEAPDAGTGPASSKPVRRRRRREPASAPAAG